MKLEEIEQEALALPDRDRALLAARRSAPERLVDFFMEHRLFLIKADIDVDHYVSRIQQSGALIAASELLRQADAQNLRLPPGYWRLIRRLREELEEHERHD